MKKRDTPRGFTIVELLIVIVVIAILATITIVAFNGIQQRARTTVAQSELASMVKKLELHKVDKGRYPSKAEGSIWKEYLIQVAGRVAGSKNYVICGSPGGTEYALIAWKPVDPLGIGDTLYYVDSKASDIQTTTWDGQGSFGTVANAACARVGFEYSDPGLWSFNL